ncbi:MAG: V-type ATP synthase subunit E family protein [Candidatus Verstraetearchaeota archaeon]|nr:V-type ATP synthase subunit E family protein [Candidatus Verstraetearchaeota archaeon]
MSDKAKDLDTQTFDFEGFNRLVDALFEETESRVSSIMDEALKSVESIFSESKKYSTRRCQEIVSSYMESSEIESRKEISKAEIEARMQLLRIKEEMVEKVFQEAKRRLLEYAQSEEYLELIKRQLKKLSERVEIGSVVMNERDIKSIGEGSLKRIVGSSAVISAQDVGTGGFILVSKDNKVSINRTIDSILGSKREVMRGKVAEKLFG